MKIGENNKNKYATQQHGRGEKKKWVKQKIYADSQDSTAWVHKNRKENTRGEMGENMYTQLIRKNIFNNKIS